MLDEQEDNRLDQSLRDKFSDFDLPPAAQVWTGIEQRIRQQPPLPERRRRPLPLPLLFGLVALLAGWGGWLLPRSGTEQTRLYTTTTPAATRALTPANSATVSAPVAGGHALATAPATALAPSAAQAANHPAASRSLRGLGRPVLPQESATQLSSAPIRATSTSPLAAAGPGVSTTGTPGHQAAAAGNNSTPITAAIASSADTTSPVPATLRMLVAQERQTLTQLPSIYTLTVDGRTTLLATLRAEQAELRRLQRRTDSLLLVLGDTPTPAVAAATDSSRSKANAQHPWSLLLAVTPEQNALSLQAPADNPLLDLRRNHETGRAGLNAALMAEYRLSPRVSLGGGLGYSTFGADLRITNRHTDVSVRYDTTTTRTTSYHNITNTVWSIRVIQLPQLNPVFNGSGQVLRYDTVYIPRNDTTFTTIVSSDTVNTIRHTTTPVITKTETTTHKDLRPDYHFLTLPLQLRYRLTPVGNSRWWADLAAGAQLQFFLGGTQVVTDDGENFRTEKVSAGSGPFRTLNVALSGSLALNYALTNRLSVSVAPSMRWQAMSLYKPETGLKQQPTATGLQFGLRWKL
jgi:hypothetical protein